MSEVQPRASGKQGESWVKKYCIKISDSRYKCCLCPVSIRIRAGNFTNFKRHIRRKHRTIYEKESTTAIINTGSESESEYTVEYLCSSADENEVNNELSVDTDKSSDDKTEIERHIKRLCATQVPGKWSNKTCIWNFFDKLRDNLYMCTFCQKVVCIFPGSVAHLRRHLVTAHKREMRLMFKYAPKHDSLHKSYVKRAKEIITTETKSKVTTESIQNIGQDTAFTKTGKQGRRSWVKKYCIKISDCQYKCCLCPVSIKIHAGNFTNFKRHIIRKHRTIYEKENTTAFTNAGSESESEYTVEYLDNSADEEVNNEQSVDTDKSSDDKTEIEGHIKRLCATQVPGKWSNKTCVWNFFDKLRDNLYKCTFCQKTICIFPESVANLRRHLVTVHKREMRLIFKYAPKHDSLHKSHVKRAKEIITTAPTPISDSCFDKIDGSTYSCKYCDQVLECYNDDQLLFKHVQDNHPNQVLMYQLETDGSSFVVL